MIIIVDLLFLHPKSKNQKQLQDIYEIFKKNVEL